MRRLMALIGGLAALLTVTGCVHRPPPQPHIVTDWRSFVRQAPDPPSDARRRQLYRDFSDRFFQPWRLHDLNMTRREATWAVRRYRHAKLYAENLRPLPAARFARWVANARYEALDTLRARAITTYPTSLRLFPTHKPIFFDPKKAGEGYPFDYNQNSAIKAMVPLYVSHLSADGAWAFARAPFAAGWVPIRDIAFVKKSRADRLMRAPQAVWFDDHAVVYDRDRRALFAAKLGTLLPRCGKKGDWCALVGCRGEATPTLLSEDAPLRTFPIPMTRSNIGAVLLQLIGEPYGWGGLGGDRDCSATVRDFFRPFGLWLPRNSSAQARVGVRIDLRGLDAKTKERVILRKGVPFRTLLHRPGHIMLYVGQRDGHAYVLQNMWGIRTKTNGRHIIGRTVITDLWLGQTLPDVDRRSLPIEGIDSMNIVLPTGGAPDRR